MPSDVSQEEPIHYMSEDGHVETWSLFDGSFHREDGPAFIEHDSGYKSWWYHDKRHCEIGPAVIGVDCGKEWWYHGQKLPVQTQEEFEQLMKLKAFW